MGCARLCMIWAGMSTSAVLSSPACLDGSCSRTFFLTRFLSQPPVDSSLATVHPFVDPASYHHGLWHQQTRAEWPSIACVAAVSVPVWLFRGVSAPACGQAQGQFVAAESSVTIKAKGIVRVS